MPQPLWKLLHFFFWGGGGEGLVYYINLEILPRDLIRFDIHLVSCKTLWVLLFSFSCSTFNNQVMGLSTVGFGHLLNLRPDFSRLWVTMRQSCFSFNVCCCCLFFIYFFSPWLFWFMLWFVLWKPIKHIKKKIKKKNNQAPCPLISWGRSFMNLFFAGGFVPRNQKWFSFHIEWKCIFMHLFRFVASWQLLLATTCDIVHWASKET